MESLAESWPSESSLYVGMKGIFKNKLKIKLWTALELFVYFLILKYADNALNCSCRIVIFFLLFEDNQCFLNCCVIFQC